MNYFNKINCIALIILLNFSYAKANPYFTKDTWKENPPLKSKISNTLRSPWFGIPWDNITTRLGFMSDGFHASPLVAFPPLLIKYWQGINKKLDDNRKMHWCEQNYYKRHPIDFLWFFSGTLLPQIALVLTLNKIFYKELWGRPHFKIISLLLGIDLLHICPIIYKHRHLLFQKKKLTEDESVVLFESLEEMLNIFHLLFTRFYPQKS